MRFKIVSVQGEGGEKGVTSVSYLKKVILDLPYSSLLKGNTLYSQYRWLSSCPQWIKPLSLRETGWLLCLSHPPSLSPTYRGNNTLLLSNHGHSIKKTFFKIMYLLIRALSTHQNTGYFDVRALRPAQGFHRKWSAKTSLATEPVESAHVPASNTKCFPASFAQHPGAVQSHVFETVPFQPVILSFPVNLFSLVNHENTKFTNHNVTNT